MGYTGIQCAITGDMSQSYMEYYPDQQIACLILDPQTVCTYIVLLKFFPESASWIAESERDEHEQPRFDVRDSGSNQGKHQQPYKVVLQKPNCYVTSPFKQGPETTRKGPVVVSLISVNQYVIRKYWDSQLM